MRWASSQLVCFALFWIAFFTNNANAQTYCSGTKLLTTLSGNITDHTGSGNYNDDMDCVWVIKPGNTTVTSITLSFQKFDLEYNYDTVVIYNCECNDVAKQYIWFTGSTIPQDVIVPGNVVTVEFFSDGGVTGAGFSLSYYANNCPNGCNGKGTCHMDHCDCYPGYNGTDCSQTYCYNNCSYPNGECNQGANSCVCDFGYYGGDCAQAYCTGTSTIGDDSGSFTDHHGYGDYLNNMNCQWLIQPNPPRQSITLSFSYFDTEAGYDFITIYDGNTTQSQVIGKYSGSNLPPSSTAISGAMLVVWTSDVGITRTGFDATFSGTDCPAGCNGQGDCINGDCHCDIGFTGTDCSNTTCTDNCFGRGICEQPEQVCNCTTTNFVGANCGSCVLEDESCQIGFCYPYFHAHNLTGVVSDKIWGEGNYMPGMECKWTIDPVPYNPGLPISGLALSFTQLELELNQAHVHVFRGDSTADEDLIGLYTGEEIPPIINLDDTVMTIVFTSSGSSIVRQGWKAEWSITYCATNCNGNGVCTLGNICECYPGWDGNDCSISVCVGTCNSPAGQCINDHCVCEPGWYSPSCSSTFCSGLTTLDGDFGTVRDHADGETYRSNSDCDFRMSHANTSETYSFVWTQFDLDGSLGDTVDYVSLYDGSSPQSAVLLSHRTGPFLPHPVRSQNNSLYLKFNSGDEVNFPGFVAVYTANSKCPGSCSGKGYCYNGTCICDQGTTGSDCATKATATKVEFDVQLNASVSSFQWNYYSFKTPKNVESLLIIAYQTSNQGNSEFFIKAHDFPGLYDYEIFYGMGTEGISVKNPPEESTIYLGVYENSLEYSNYTINISVEKGSVVDYRGAAIALLVLVFVFFGLAGVCVFVLWKKTRKLKQQQREETGLPEQTQEMGSVPQQQGPGYARFQDE